MSDPGSLLRRFTQEDLAASTIRVALGLAGPLGSIMAEFLTQFVPQQRLDRLQDFVEQLDAQLGDLREEFRAKQQTSAGYSALVEQATSAAVQTPSADRRRDLAALLRTGLREDDAELLHHLAILQLLDRVNEAQILMLMSRANFRGTFGDEELMAFHRTHSGVFDIEPLAMSDDPDSAKGRAYYMDRYYINELVQLGLLEDVEGMVKSAGPRNVRITGMGLLLLKAIGRYRNPEAS